MDIKLSRETALALVNFLKARPYKEVNGFMQAFVGGSPIDISAVLAYLVEQPWEQVSALLERIQKEIRESASESAQEGE